ncbi:hypothetical protein MS3_00006305 [Schistosoma haematobium]|uniref:UVR domain-containing protein n=1 Tax=Schistosoma haematobium TaxID=6185 RepID=A0A922S522_SCHHA|nr:hypothetical protein MS3_00006305 [Schistosoma haematobium]KAH9594466.1 hypothetical protein MS3_00006305 [Schistosoma haematobium]
MPHKLPFRVVYVSSQDEHFPATELNHHHPGTKGWISTRFCSYPQQLILSLEAKASFRKIQLLCHQYLIASKIEFFVGDTPDDEMEHFKNARYTRLGYVALSDNQATEYKARELKSVHIDASGSYIQLFLYKNHPNNLNLYSQVGIVAINLIGDFIDKNGRSDSDDSPVGLFRPDYIPPTEDLAFDMYQDPEVANIIRRLEKQKRLAVKAERFDQAQGIRDAITQLHQVGERLGRLALEKQQAVEEENYEQAKLKKNQITEMRNNLYRDIDLMKLLSSNTSTEQREQLYGRSDNQFPDTNNDRNKINPIQPIHFQSLLISDDLNENRRSNGSYTVNNNNGNNNNQDVDYFPFRRAYPSNDPDERPLPALKNKHRSNSPIVDPADEEHYTSELPVPVLHEQSFENFNHSEHMPPLDAVEAIQRDIDIYEDEQTMKYLEQAAHDRMVDGRENFQHSIIDLPEPMSETNRRQAGVAIDVVGINLVTKAYSKSWVFREKALFELEQRVTAPKLPPPVSLPDTAHPDPKAEIRSTTFLLRRALNDQVLSIFRLATKFVKPTIVNFADRYGIPRPDLYYCMDKLTPVIFQRTGDTSSRVREIAKQQILDMAQWPQMKQNTTFWNELVRPFSPVTLDRLALSRIELATELYASRGVDPVFCNEHGHVNQGSFTLEALTIFTAKCLDHRSNEVREAAENLIVALYRSEDRATVRRLIPLDDVNSNRHPLYRRLLGKFDRIDGRYDPPLNDRPPAIKASVKQREVEALQADVQQLRAIVEHGNRGHLTTHKPNSRVSRTVPSQNYDRKSASRLKNNDRKSANNSQHGPPSVSPNRQNHTSNQHGSRITKSDNPNRNSSTANIQLEINSQQHTEEAEFLLSLDKTCIFCGEQNDSFTEEGLDIHYWKSCPMLHRCPNCKQAFEIAGLTDHLLKECEACTPGQYVRCSKCSEAVLKTHLSNHHCLPIKLSSGLRCPLCHHDLPNLPDSVAPGGPEDVWKAHLLGSSNSTIQMPQCTENPRSLQSQQQKYNGHSTKNTSTSEANKTKSGIPRPLNVNKVRPV